MTSLSALARRLAGATFAQAARVAERVGAGRNGQEVGRDARPADEPVRFAASARMGLVAGDVAEVAIEDGRPRIVANVIGLAGATPALPATYSELQLQRRRARDPGFADFLNLFDHRALSFFWRIAQKYSWPLLAERAGRGGEEPVRDLLLALSGIGVGGLRERLDIADGALVTLVAQLGDTRRSAAGAETVLRALTGWPLSIVEALPTWMAVPPSEQTRIGALRGCFAQLGTDRDDGAALAGAAGGAAMIGAAVLDVQHHFLIDIGPLPYADVQRFCRDPAARRLVSQLVVLAVGLEQRPSIRLLVAGDAIPPLQLGGNAAPAMLGWTSWLGAPPSGDGIARDCVIPIDRAAVNHEKVVVAGHA